VRGSRILTEPKSRTDTRQKSRTQQDIALITATGQATIQTQKQKQITGSSRHPTDNEERPDYHRRVKKTPTMELPPVIPTLGGRGSYHPPAGKGLTAFRNTARRGHRKRWRQAYSVENWAVNRTPQRVVGNTDFASVTGVRLGGKKRG